MAVWRAQAAAFRPCTWGPVDEDALKNGENFFAGCGNQ
jgi:hypothetical protein